MSDICICQQEELYIFRQSRIPNDVQIDAIDMHGSWADNFEEYIQEYKDQLTAGTEINMFWGDVEQEDVWKQLDGSGSYDMVITHYLLFFLKEQESFIAKAADLLADGGMFSCNGYEVSPEHFYWKAVFEELKLSSSFISKVIDTKIEKQEQFKRLLEEYFSRVDSVQLDNMMQYDNSDDLFNRLLEHYPEEKKYIMTNEGKIKEYLDAKQIAVTVKRGIEDVLIVV